MHIYLTECFLDTMGRIIYSKDKYAFNFIINYCLVLLSLHITYMYHLEYRARIIRNIGHETNVKYPLTAKVQYVYMYVCVCAYIYIYIYDHVSS